MDGHLNAPVVQDQAAQQQNNEDPFGLRQLWLGLRRRLPLAMFSGAVVTAAALAVLAVQPPRYEAKALLLINSDQQRPLTDNGKGEGPRSDPNFVNSQVAVIKSRAIAEKLVDALKLTDDPQWNGTSGGGRKTSRAAVVRAVAEAIDARHENQTNVVEAIAHAKSPEMAARMANALADVFVTSQRQARIDSASRTAQWLRSRLDELRNDLQQREAAVEQYRAATGLLTADGVPLTEHQITDAEGAVMAARADVAEKQARYQQVQQVINSNGSAESLAGMLPSSETLVQLRARQADAKRSLADMTTRYGNSHPTLIATRQQLADLNQQADAEISRQAAILANEATIARTRMATLQQGLGAVRGQLISNNTALVHLRELERESAVARSIYENFLQRFKEIETGADTFGTTAQLVSAAAPPPPMSNIPKVTTVALALAFGLAIGVLIALLVDQMHQTLEGSDDIAQKLGLPLLSSIPVLRRRDLRGLRKISANPAGVAVAKPMSAFAESFRVVRARLAHVKDGQKVRISAVTSALPGEGKSNTALALARISAMSGQRVMIIDCDLRRCSLNLLLGIAPEAGIAQVLKGEKRWQDVAGRDELSGADILPASIESFSPVDLFGSDAMKQLLADVSRVYDLIILDCPPVLTLAEARTLSALADGVIFVIRRGKTPLYAARTAIAQLQDTGARVLGVVFNGVDPNASGRISYTDPLYFNRAQRGLYGI